MFRRESIVILLLLAINQGIEFFFIAKKFYSIEINLDCFENNLNFSKDLMMEKTMANFFSRIKSFDIRDDFDKH